MSDICGSFGGKEIEDYRILRYGFRYLPQIKVKGLWCSFDTKYCLWRDSTLSTKLFCNETMAKKFLDSHLTSFANPLGE